MAQKPYRSRKPGPTCDAFTESGERCRVVAGMGREDRNLSLGRGVGGALPAHICGVGGGGGRGGRVRERARLRAWCWGGLVRERVSARVEGVARAGGCEGDGAGRVVVGGGACVDDEAVHRPVG